MLLYLSERKINNLNLEFQMEKGLSAKTKLSSFKTKLGVNFGVANGSLESQHTVNEENVVSQIIKILKSNNMLKELKTDTPIKPSTYYSCNCLMSYKGRINGYLSQCMSTEMLERFRGDPRSFFSDDKLEFVASISHNIYQSVNFTCTADSIKVFGDYNLSNRYGDLFKNNELIHRPHSGDPGILYREIRVRLIFWCLDTSEPLGIIKGSPLMIYC